jgi:two-component system sensor histidine kinase VanS
MPPTTEACRAAPTYAERAGSKRIRTDHEGAALGLAIVKSIAQAHDGTLSLAPRVAGGLCVTVQLPAAARKGPSLRG